MKRQIKATVNLTTFYIVIIGNYKQFIVTIEKKSKKSSLLSILVP